MTDHHESLFPPLNAIDAVTRESQALALRYRLMRALTDEHGIRRDLRGAAPEPELLAEMIRQLVPGVDAPIDATAVDWPIPAGVRLETLHASPWLSDIVTKRGLYTLPQTAAEFAEIFRQHTGIAPESDGMARNHRVTPIELGQIAMQVRGEGEDPSSAFLMLCSRHFDEATEQASFLSKRREGIDFRRPLIDGFTLLAELEREALILQNLERLNILPVARIRKLLSGDGRALRRNLIKYPALRRLLAYQMIGSESVSVFERISLHDPDVRHIDDLALIPDVAQKLGIGADVRAVAAARGDTDVDLVKALTGPGGAQARTLLLAAFPENPPGTRESPLQKQDPAAFYGLNSVLAEAMQADLGTEFQHGDLHEAGHADFERQAVLASEILRHAAPVQHARTLAKTAKQKKSTGENRQRDATAYGKLMLPGPAYQGSAPRAHAACWLGRYRDADLWRAMLHRDLTHVDLDLSDSERDEIQLSWARTRAIFTDTFDASCSAADTQEQEDAVRAACDMATGVSAISTNRAFARAMLAWVQIFGTDEKMLDKKRSHGLRWLAALRHVLRVRRHSGAPPTGDGAKGSPYGRKYQVTQARALKTK